ncbi:MAG: GNAT family N-acetyltransferase [Rhodospirillales bacterium]
MQMQSMVPVVETDRLRLRGWTLKDFEPFAAFRQDGDDQAYKDGAATRFQAWLEFAAKAGEWGLYGAGAFIVADKATDTAVGYAGLWRAPYIAEPELCWSLFPGHRGRGYATEAALTARDWAYRELGLKPLMSFVHPENLPSRAVAERIGAVIEGEGELRGEPRLIYRHLKP